MVTNQVLRDDLRGESGAVDIPVLDEPPVERTIASIECGSEVDEVDARQLPTKERRGAQILAAPAGIEQPERRSAAG